MKLAVFWMVALLCIHNVGAQAAPRGWKPYNGSWFRVSIPLSWKAAAKDKLPSQDSALFTSPDGRAQFTVYSPLWNGKPPEVKRDVEREILVAQRQTVTQGDLKSTIRTRWLTFKTADGRWTRSVVDRENVSLNTRLTFGFAYRDQKAYNRYKPAFEAFKKSLVQFSD